MRTTCRYFGRIHPPSKCPAFGKQVFEIFELNHFSAICQASTAYNNVNQLHEAEEEEVPMAMNVEEFTIGYTECSNFYDGPAAVPIRTHELARN